MNAARSRILLVDDNDEMRAFLHAHLVDRYRVEVASSGEEAWCRIQESPPDLVVSDTEMDGIGGWALCRRLKQETDLPSIPIILMSEARTPFTADASGPEEVLPKPFTADELDRRMERHLPDCSVSEWSGTDGAGAFLKEVLQIIEKRLHDPTFAVEELADELSLSRRHVTRRLKEVADTTPAALIQDRRIERAKVLLEDDPEIIREVGQAVGFKSASYFSQVFRKKVGCSPSTFRERHGA